MIKIKWPIVIYNLIFENVESMEEYYKKHFSEANPNRHYNDEQIRIRLEYYIKRYKEENHE